MKNKLLFKNHTTYSKEVYDDFVKFHGSNNNTKYFIYTLFIFVLSIYCFVLSIKNGAINVSIIFGTGIFLFIAYRIFFPIYEYKKESKAKQITDSYEFIYYFYEKSFKIRYKADFEKELYFNIHKIYETEKYVYIYISKKYAYILDKSGFTMGTYKDFSNFLQSKFKFKYKNTINK